MASSTQKPSSSSTSIHKYNFDVFLSFRGEDTRNNFTDHLFVNLTWMGINTFRDDQLERGEEIKSELLKTIEESRISVVVFSKNYAHSKWCLDELAKIMECRKEMEQIVLPVFYHVDPSDVRKQTGSFGEAFSTHERNVDEKKVQRWRVSLTEASNLSGFHVNNGYESKHIKDITNDILKSLDSKLLDIDGDIVGMDFHLKELIALLSSHLNDIHVVGIYGTGGIGKTTLAKIVYNKIQYQFNGASFLQDVRERSKNGYQLELQQQLLHDIMGKDVECGNINEGINIIRNRLGSKNILIVIDDVDHLKQLESLARSPNWFGPGSRIIITTRDQHLLGKYGVNIPYEATKLHDEEAIQLFSRHAFKQNVPKEDFVNLSNCMVHYAQGLPLALKVLGSSLHGMEIDEWKSTLDKLKKYPEREINDVLRISFDGLDDSVKEVFLDIACFFKRESKDYVLRILDGCNLFATWGIRVLCDRCLVTILDNTIQMHDLIQQMGWTIVREEFPGDPSKWSRLWDVDDIYDAFSRQEGMENIQTLSLELSKSKEIQFTTKVFAKMKKLRLLKIYCNDYDGLTREKYKVLRPKDFEFLHNLRYLHWEGCSLRSWPSNFSGKNLIEVNLKSSNIKQLWKENKCLEKLKAIDLSNSKRLVKMPKFSSMPDLEGLNLEGCASLRELHSSIGDLKRLTSLNLEGCEQLKRFPIGMRFESLEVLYLNGCRNVKKFPEIHGNMKFLRELCLSNSGIKELPSSIGYLESLEILDLSYCSKFEKFPEIRGNMKCLKKLSLDKTAIKELPNSIGSLTSLENFSLKECSKFEKFSDIFTNMGLLRELSLYKSGIKELPGSIGYLESLEILNLSYCSNLEKFPEIQGNMKCLNRLYLGSTAIKELPNSIGCLEALEILNLSGCSNFEKFPEIQKNMGSLLALYLDKTAINGLPCSIGHLTRLDRLDLENCRNLRNLPNNICGLKSLKDFSLSSCSNLEAFSEIAEDMEHLENLYLRETGITELPSSIGHLRGLRHLELNKCEKLVTLPNSIGNLTCLTSLRVRNCSKLHNLPDNLRSLQCCLISLDLGGCNLMEGEIPSDLWCLSSLEFLNVSENHIRCIPAGITQLPKLRTLLVNHCPMLKEIRELPSSLGWIEAHGCPCLETEDSSSLLWSSLLKRFKSPIQRGFNIVIPGSSGIPDWVTHQKMGCEVCVELPMNWYKDNNLLGFALFFHHVPLDDDECETTGGRIPQCHLTISHGDQSEYLKEILFHPYCKTYWISGLSYGSRCYDSGSTSDPAIWVTYFPQIDIPSEYRSRRWNTFKAHFDTPVGNGSFVCGDNASFKVKSCGIYVMYAQDYHQQNQKHWPQLSRESPGDREDHPARKRFSSFQRIKAFFKP